MASKDAYRSELRSAVRHLSDRCLYSAAKWAAELLVGLESEHNPDSAASSSASASTSATASRTHSLRRLLRTGLTASADVTATPLAGVSYVSTPVPNDDLGGYPDAYLLAKIYFDCKEYRRAAHALRGQVGKKAVFLRCYALYLAGEKRKEEEMIELEGHLGKSEPMNKELSALERELSTLHGAGTIDSFGLYLFGIILRDKGCEKQAVNIFVESVNSYPWYWSAWSELLSLCTTTEILKCLSLKNHWMKDFFIASAYQELKMHEEALKQFEYLLGAFRFSDYIHSQIATAHYGLRALDEAEMIFEEILRNDPYCVDSMDIYSNLLYYFEKENNNNCALIIDFLLALVSS